MGLSAHIFEKRCYRVGTQSASSRGGHNLASRSPIAADIGFTRGTGFSEALRQDCRAWCVRLTGNDLRDGAPFRPVRPATLAHREQHIRDFTSALVRMGRDPATLTSRRDLVDIGALRRTSLFSRPRGQRNHDRDCRSCEQLEGRRPTSCAGRTPSFRSDGKHHSPPFVGSTRATGN
jgi:hypothetical protein